MRPYRYLQMPYPDQIPRFTNGNTKASTMEMQMKMTMTVHTRLTILFLLCRGFIKFRISYPVSRMLFSYLVSGISYALIGIFPLRMIRKRIPDTRYQIRTTGYDLLFSTLMNASAGMSTFPFPMLIIFAFPFFCFSSTLRFLVTSPP